MNTVLEVTAVFLGVLGAGPGLFSIYYYFFNLLPSRKFLGFSSKLETSIIVTTSTVEKNQVGASVVRATTGVGQLKSVAVAARVFGLLYSRTTPSLFLSEQLDYRPNAHIILFGGPARNSFTKLFLEQPQFGELTFDDIQQSVRADEYSFDGVEINSENGMPIRETVLVAATHNPFAKDSRARAVLCCGLTSFGTNAAANWYFDELILLRPRRKVTYNGKLKKVDQNFLALLEVDYVGGQPAGVKMVYYKKLTS